MILIRLLGAMLGITLIVWAYEIIDNIWQYNDSSTLAYVVFAAIPGVTGLLLVYSSLRRPRR